MMALTTETTTVVPMKMSEQSEVTSDQISRAIAVVIRDRRRELGMSQDEIAARSQLHRTYISDIERGARNLSTKNLFRLAAALEMDCSALVRLVEAMVRVTSS
jgi:ribosome-binding protein aMBF1 (putative translation factor)